MTEALVIVISFHRQFVTKVDRAYKIKCFYMEAEKLLTAGLDVSMLSTVYVDGTNRMPICTYTLRKQPKSTAPPVKYANVGDPVYHLWVGLNNILTKGERLSNT